MELLFIHQWAQSPCSDVHGLHFCCLAWMVVYLHFVTKVEKKGFYFGYRAGGIAYGPRPDLKSKLEIFQCFETCLQTIPNCRFRGVDVALGRATAARGLSPR